MVEVVVTRFSYPAVRPACRQGAMPTAARVLGVFKLVAAQAATHPVDELGYRVWVVVEGKALAFLLYSEIQLNVV